MDKDFLFDASEYFSKTEDTSVAFRERAGTEILLASLRYIDAIGKQGAA